MNGLGFRVSFKVSDDGRTGILGLERGGIRIAIDCPMPGHGRNACVAFEVESADTYYDESRHKVQIKRPPHNEPWGARTFDLLDPFGNTIFVVEPVR